jgi:hypothetical protein
MIGFGITGRVTRINEDVTRGNSYYYFTLSNVPNKIFVGSSSVSNELPLTQKMDSIKIWYEDSRTQLIDISQFDNLELNTRVTEQQELVQ